MSPEPLRIPQPEAKIEISCAFITLDHMMGFVNFPRNCCGLVQKRYEHFVYKMSILKSCAPSGVNYNCNDT